MKKSIIVGTLFLLALLTLKSPPKVSAINSEGQSCPSSRPLETCSIVSPPGANDCISNGFCDPQTGTVQYCCKSLLPPAPTTSDDKASDEIFCQGDSGINTAIGCIPINDTGSFVAFLLRWGIGIGGGIALLLIVVAGFQIMSSNGVPEKIQAGKELMTSAITGIIMLIFSVFILRFIGVDLLSLPGLN